MPAWLPAAARTPPTSAVARPTTIPCPSTATTLSTLPWSIPGFASPGSAIVRVGIVTRVPIAASSTFAEKLLVSLALAATSCSLLSPVSSAIVTTISTTPTAAFSTGGYWAPCWVSGSSAPTTPAFAPVTAPSAPTICSAAHANWASGLGTKAAASALRQIVPSTRTTASAATTTCGSWAPQTSALLLLVLQQQQLLLLLLLLLLLMLVVNSSTAVSTVCILTSTTPWAVILPVLAAFLHASSTVAHMVSA
mmetsp:Transcript_114271/g.227388  ORF Transcript_114271/g.227388 Transcript_114271/m.227388 type:complete len:251 (-) Transcript_114271:884-1636(-)